jgi:hypothetical protein
MKYKLKSCCDGLSQAIVNGTDNEGWGAAIHFYNDTGRLKIGCVEYEVTRCPFCGKKIKVMKVEA